MTHTKIQTDKKLDPADFICDEGGSAAMLFGLAFVPAMLMLGVASDYTRATTVRSALQEATDVAVLKVATHPQMSNGVMTEADAKKRLQIVLNSQTNMGQAIVDTATISENKQTLCATTGVTIQNSFMQIAQIKSLRPTVKSCADLAGGVEANITYEIALVLDNSGSMASSAGGVSKMQALRTAANSFVDNMFDKVTTPNKLKISVTPFNATVRAVDPSVSSNRTASWVDTQGNSSIHWRAFGGKAAATAAGFPNRFGIFDRLSARRSSWAWDGCFESQPYPMNVNDTAPTSSNPDTLMVPYLAPDEPDGEYYVPGSWWGFKYGNSYLSDDNAGSGCASQTEQWGRLTRVCKYNISASTNAINTGTRGPNGYCNGGSTQTLMRLSTTRSVVKSKITSLVEGGNTNIHDGVMWGWRTISPNAPFADGMAYNAAQLRKIMVVMSDGANVWSSRPRTAGGSDFQAHGYYSFNGTANVTLPTASGGSTTNFQTQLAAAAPNNGNSFNSAARNAVDELTRQACANAKAQNIEIFTIGFSTTNDPIDAQGLALLKGCATNDDHYFEAANAAELNDAFSQIGIGLGKLRLSY